jgi:hypothetical protein
MKEKSKIKSLVLFMAFALLTLPVQVFASNTSNFTQTINAGTLTIDIVDGSYVTVASPSVTFAAQTFSFACQSSTGTLGTATQQIYVRNPDAADGGWTASIAGSAATAVWDSAGTDYDFNDSTGSGCTDGADADSVGGQMTVNANAGTLAIGACSGCTTTSITKGSSTAFVETTTNSVTLLSAAAGSDDIGDWTLQGVALSQTIPGEQPAATDYDINMVVSVVAI